MERLALKRPQDVADLFFKYLEEHHGINRQDIYFLLKQRIKEEAITHVPSEIFNNTKLSILEAMTKYLRENIGLKYSKIAELLGRNTVPIACTYRNAKKKLPQPFKDSKLQASKYMIPLFIFSNTRLSVLEAVASYLREDLGLSFHQIAVLLNRNDRTIWTAYHRANKKRKNETKV